MQSHACIQYFWQWGGAGQPQKCNKSTCENHKPNRTNIIHYLFPTWSQVTSDIKSYCSYFEWNQDMSGNSIQRTSLHENSQVVSSLLALLQISLAILWKLRKNLPHKVMVSLQPFFLTIVLIPPSSSCPSKWWKVSKGQGCWSTSGSQLTSVAATATVHEVAAIATSYQIETAVIAVQKILWLLRQQLCKISTSCCNSNNIVSITVAVIATANISGAAVIAAA